MAADASWVNVTREETLALAAAEAQTAVDAATLAVRAASSIPKPPPQWGSTPEGEELERQEKQNRLEAYRLEHGHDLPEFRLLMATFPCQRTTERGQFVAARIRDRGGVTRWSEV